MKGLVQNASTGGTPMRAPIGYRNTLHRDDLGCEVRDVKIDDERAPLVKWAFTAYAPGNYSLAQIRAELAKRGHAWRGGFEADGKTYRVLIRAGAAKAKAKGAVA